jgi:hypothetical protein
MSSFEIQTMFGLGDEGGAGCCAEAEAAIPSNTNPKTTRRILIPNP